MDISTWTCEDCFGRFEGSVECVVVEPYEGGDFEMVCEDCWEACTTPERFVVLARTNGDNVEVALWALMN